MNEKNGNNNELQKLFEQASIFIERMVDKRLASEAQAQKQALHSRSRNLTLATLSLAVSLGVEAAGIIANGYAENRDRDDQVMREASQRKLKIIKPEILSTYRSPRKALA